MGEFVNGIGQSIGGVFENAMGAVSAAFGSLIHTANAWIPGGFPVFIVLATIAVLVGLATLRR
jgi:hypothetical protein